MVTKTIAERHHAKRRAEERYGIQLGQHYRKICNLIGAQFVGNTILRDQHEENGILVRFLKKESNSRSRWEVSVPGKWASTIKVVYDRWRRELVTILPTDL